MRKYNIPWNKIITFSFCLIGLSIVTLFFYLRFFRAKTSLNLLFVFFDMQGIHINYKVLLMSILFIFFSSMALFFNYKVKNKVISSWKQGYTEILTTFLKLIQKSLESFEGYIFTYIPDAYIKIRILSMMYYKRFRYNTYYINFTVLLFSYGIISLIFLYEVFFLFTLKFFYLVLPLITLPLILAYLMRLIALVCDNLDTIENLLIIKHNFLPDGQDHFIFYKNLNISLTNEQFISYQREYLTIYPLRGFLSEYHDISKRTKPYFQCIMYGSYILGWGYVLLNNLILLYDTTII